MFVSVLLYNVYVTVLNFMKTAISVGYIYNKRCNIIFQDANLTWLIRPSDHMSSSKSLEQLLTIVLSLTLKWSVLLSVPPIPLPLVWGLACIKASVASIPVQHCKLWTTQSSTFLGIVQSDKEGVLQVKFTLH